MVEIMDQGSVAERVHELAEQTAIDHGVELVHAEVAGPEGHPIVRVFIDKPGGVTHDDCSDVSHHLGTVLDVEDAIPSAYLLEVSSPGLDRKLLNAKDYERFVGSRVKLMTREPIAGNRHFEGRLESFDGNRITLESSLGKKKKGKPQESKRVEIEFANIERANLVPEI